MQAWCIYYLPKDEPALMKQKHAVRKGIVVVLWSIVYHKMWIDDIKGDIHDFNSCWSYMYSVLCMHYIVPTRYKHSPTHTYREYS